LLEKSLAGERTLYFSIANGGGKWKARHFNASAFAILALCVANCYDFVDLTAIEYFQTRERKSVAKLLFQDARVAAYGWALQLSQMISMRNA
jgi:chromosome condensin MukBEF complex kleisin-like MukF subunit